jgi:hypothetical protein
MMDCKDQEKALFTLLSEEIDATERAELLKAAREHALRCAVCAGDRELLDWAGGQPAALAADEDPGQEYWDSFEARVSQRLDQQSGSEEERVRELPARPARRTALPWMALAATLLFALIGWALIVKTNRAPSQEATLDRERPQAPLTEEVISEIAEALLADATAAQEQFERDLQELELSDMGEALGSLEGLGPDGEIELQAAGWIPDLSELDDAAQTEMLAWLEERI